jgi:hypothetical protein
VNVWAAAVADGVIPRSVLELAARAEDAKHMGVDVDLVFREARAHPTLSARDLLEQAIAAHARGEFPAGP